MELVIVIFSLFVCLSSAVYAFLRRQQSLLRRAGLPVAARPHLVYGNVKGISQTEHSCTVAQRLYREFRDRGLPLGGFMNYFVPTVLVTDPELAKSVLVRDFDVFHDRGVFVATESDPISGNLFGLEGNQWRVMRQKLSPAFTSGKMKHMFGGMVDVADQMSRFLDRNCDRELEMRDALQRYTIDVIGNVAFGVQCNSMDDSDSEFRQMGTKAFQFDAVQRFKIFVGGQYRALMKGFGMKVFPDDVARFFRQLTASTVEYREKNGVRRNDFISLMMDIKGKDGGLSMDELSAQCFLFFTAGFETSSATMGFCLYELAMNPDIQDRLRKEIVEAIEKDHEGFTYEKMLAMEYLDRVIKETLRKYPVAETLFRTSATQFLVPDSKYVIPANVLLQIPVYAMHHDPQYYPEPDRFDPDRFLPEATRSRHPYSYLPFGEGPRNCVGMRFGLMQVKVGLVMLLRHFAFTQNARTPLKIEFDPKFAVLAPRGGMYFDVQTVGRNKPVEA